MSVQRPFKVDCGELSPHGLGVVSEVEPLADFDKSSKDNRVQARDKDTGLPLWSVEVLDFDPRVRDKTFKVKIAAAVQPVPRTPLRAPRCDPRSWRVSRSLPTSRRAPGRGSPTACGARVFLPRVVIVRLIREKRPDHDVG